MVNWRGFTPTDFEYDFQRDELAAHRISFEEAVECFFSDFEVRRNKSYKDRYQLIRANCWRPLTQADLPTQAAQRRAHYHWMGYMTKRARNLSEDEIDRRVVAQADDDSAWEESVCARRSKSAAVSLSSELASRAAFFARLHREANVEEWLRRIIEERIDIEEAVFAESKRDLAKQ
ncbi:MAG TPA: hypothetical protein VGC89_12295 [Pyrinomonadaceae bacterium]|jgi:hypothetical protein